MITSAAQIHVVLTFNCKMVCCPALPCSDMADGQRPKPTTQVLSSCPFAACRQLEALIRISESFARMSLAAEADDGHVAAAFDLFTKSTINAMNAGLISSSTDRLEVRCLLFASCSTACLTVELCNTRDVTSCQAAVMHRPHTPWCLQGGGEVWG